MQPCGWLNFTSTCILVKPEKGHNDLDVVYDTPLLQDVVPH